MNLPQRSYVREDSTGRTLCIERGNGTYVCNGTATAEQRNRAVGVIPQEAYAMLVGSRLGWDHPHADPAAYTAIQARALLGLPASEIEV